VNLGHDLIEAKKALLKLEEGRSIAGTIGELLDDHLEAVRSQVEAGKRSARTYRDNLIEAKHLKIAFARMTPASLKPSHVWQYLHKARGKEAPVRANREVALLSSAFNYAMGAGIVDRNPCIGVRRNEETSRDRYVSDAELDAFCTFARAGGHLVEGGDAHKWSDAGLRVALVAELAYITGKSQAQVLRLSKTQLKDEGIEFGKRKRGVRTLVQWTTELRRLVDECLALPREIETVYVLCNRAGQPYAASGFRTLWQRLQRAWWEAGKPDKESKESANMRFRFHDLRAKAVTDVIEQGRKASELTGHRTEQIPARIYDRRAIRKSPAVK
jgi:site-specific recombinase XerD